MSDASFLILGGAGLVGRQVALRIAADLNPGKIVIASLHRREVEAALDGPRGLRAACPEPAPEFVAEWGDVFLREEFAAVDRRVLLEDRGHREKLFEDLHGPVDDAYRRSHLVRMIERHRPDVIVDAINTATAISYQDMYTASIVGKRQIDRLLGHLEAGDVAAADGARGETERAIDTLVVSEAVPQLVRHVLLIQRAMSEAGTRLYLKIGTTGTGGMGLNIPYTHSEDRPSAKLLTKTAVAFAHTGLLFLMARTPDGPIVKELKPGAMIGYADIDTRAIRRGGRPMRVFRGRHERLGATLELRADEAAFEATGDLELPVVDTGENGLFTKGEFEAITSIGQMEFITPEEIAAECVQEIKGSNTGHDLIAEIDSAVMLPTYRAGVLRQRALDSLERIEATTGTHSVAIGALGPPELSKLLWEAELLRVAYGTLERVLAERPAAISARLHELVVEQPKVCDLITSIGVPILLASGGELIRGPFLNIPEVPGDTEVECAPAAIDRWAAKGWVDLREANMAVWHRRLQRLDHARRSVRMRGSAAVTLETYRWDEIRIGAVVGWIFNNELGGYRIK